MKIIWDYIRLIVGGKDRACKVHRPATIEEIAEMRDDLKRLVDDHDEELNKQEDLR